MAKLDGVKVRTRVKMELGRLNAALTRQVDVMNLNMGEAVKKTAFELEARIKERTPVATGRLRASFHTVTFGGPKNFTYSVPRPSKKNPQTSFDGTLQTYPANLLEAIVGTNVFYALNIEAGQSRKAPAGMVRIALASLREEFRASIKRAMRKKTR